MVDPGFNGSNQPIRLVCILCGRNGVFIDAFPDWV